MVLSFEDFKTQMKSELSHQFGQENFLDFWGNQDAKIVSISQAPSLSAIKANKPFADQSGEKLRHDWYEISNEAFYNPANFYFTAIGRYYPGRSRSGDKTPSRQLAQRWLTQELSYLHPQLYIVIGRVAAHFFFGSRPFGELVQTDQKINNTPAVILPHPSPRNIRWFEKHPEFVTHRLPQVRKQIHAILKLDE